jgi:hypothetical protein
MKSNEHNLYILSTSDREQLAQLLTNALLHFNHYHSTSEDAFLNNLYVVADCYRLILLHSGKEVLLDERLKLFTQYFEVKSFHFKLEKVSLAIAEMISRVADQIRLLSFPWFYRTYVAAIDSLLSNKIAYLHVNKQAGKLLRDKLIPSSLGRNA